MARTGRPQDVWKHAGSANAPPAQPGPRTSRGAGRWFLAALLAVALVGTIVGLLIYLWPMSDPTVLAIPVTAYDQVEWSPNPWAEADARGFLEATATNSALTFQSQEKSAIVGELNDLANDPRWRPVVVYLSALGVPSNGTVYLVPSKGKLDDPTTWLSLDEIFAPLRRAGGPKLLILDVRPASDTHGLLAGADVNEVLDATLAKSDLPGFVLTANTPAEGPNVLRPVRRTAFGLALAQGAGGGADGWNPDRKRNGRVSALELASYTSALTHYVSVTAGLPPQFPRLHGSFPDFDLFRVPREGPTKLPDMADPEPYPDWLQIAWTERDKWFDDGLHRRAPRMTRQLTLVTSRAERQWLAGVNPDTIRPPFLAVFDRRTEVVKTLARVAQPVRSVARARGKVTPAAVEKHFEEVFKLIKNPPPMDAAKAIDGAVMKLVPKTVEPEPFDASAVTIFDFVQKMENPTPDQLRSVAALVERFWPGSPQHAELITVSLIGKLPEELVRRWPAATIATLVQVALVAEEATAGDGRCLPWIKTKLEKADETRRKAVATLCDPNSTRDTRTAALSDLNEARGGYESVRADVRALAGAVREYEETRAVLVDLATAYPLDALLNPKLASDRWNALVENFQGMQKLLRPAGQPADVPKLQAATRDLEASRKNLRLLLSLPDFRGIRQLEQALRWPHWTVAERRELYRRLGEAEREATNRVLQNWPKEPTGRDIPPLPKSSPAVAENGARDLRRSVDVLRLAGWPGATEMATEADPLQRNPAAAGVLALSRKVRAANRLRLPEVYTSADGPQRAAFGWAVDTDEVPAFGEVARGVPETPELADRRRQEKEFHEWLARSRYEADAEVFAASSLKPVQTLAPAYREIAKAYASSFADKP